MKIHLKNGFNFEMKNGFELEFFGPLIQATHPVWIKWKKQNINNQKNIFSKKKCFLLYIIKFIFF